MITRGQGGQSHSANGVIALEFKGHAVAFRVASRVAKWVMILGLLIAAGAA